MDATVPSVKNLLRPGPSFIRCAFTEHPGLSFAAVDRCSAGLCAHPGALSDCSYSELEPDRSKPDHTKPGPGSTE